MILLSRLAVEKNISYDDTKKLYYVCLNYGKNPDTGKQDKVYKTYDRLSDARKARDLHEAERKAAKLKEKEYRAPNKITITKAIEQFFTLEKAGDSKLEETTEVSYRNIFNNHFLPFCSIIGKSYCKDFNRKDFQRYFIWLAEERNLSPNSTVKHYSLLKNLFYMLQKDGVVAINPLLLVDKPKREAIAKNVFTVDEAVSLFDVFSGDNVELAVLLGVMMGLRREEMSALKWSNVHLDENYLDVVEARVYVNKHIVEKDVKTISSYRALYLPKRVKALLQEMEKQQEQDKRDFGEAYIENDFVLKWPNGKPYNPTYLYDHYKLVREKEGLRDISLHDLRKTFASVATECCGYGLDVKQVLGHHPDGVTEQHYIHIYDRTGEKVIKRVEKEYENAYKKALKKRA